MLKAAVTGSRTYLVPGTRGPIGGDMSHEFIILAETGESGVYFRSGRRGNSNTGVPGRKRPITAAVSATGTGLSSDSLMIIAFIGRSYFSAVSMAVSV